MSIVRFRLSGIAALLSLLTSSVTPLPLLAATTEIPRSVLQAVVIVQCGNRQGSGTLINNRDNYVLTNAHVAMDVQTETLARNCVVGFVDDPTQKPIAFYRANIIRSVFQPEGNLDFAILQISQPLSQRTIPQPFPMLKTDEFSVRHTPISVAGYPGGNEQLIVSTGTIQGFRNGFIQTDAELNPGDSGGSAFDEQNNLIGIPTRIVTITTDDPRDTETTYELVDIRNVFTWLDKLGTNETDKYFTHADPERYHLKAVFISDASLGCVNYARIQLSSTVYCLLPNNERLVFPNTNTYMSWLVDFDTVRIISLEDMASYRIKRNVTYKPGSLIKSATSPSVYVVVDDRGTIRMIPSESRATDIWGPNWANLVRDIPDEFWSNYTVGQPLAE